MPRKQSSHSVFLNRTRSIYHSSKKRLGSLPFTLEEFRSDVRQDLHTPCRYCEVTLTEKNFSSDHYIPVSRGGKAHITNLQVICLGCNTAKGMLTGYEFAALIETMRRVFTEDAMKNTLARLKSGGRFTHADPYTGPVHIPEFQ